MIDYHTYAQIHELRTQKQLTAAAIATHLNLHPRTVSKYLKQPRFSPPKPPQRPSKLEPFKPAIRHLLAQHDYSITQILQQLKTQGYSGGRSILADYFHQIAPKQKPAFLSLAFAPGDAAQIDFTSCGYLLIGNHRCRLYAFVMVLCHSRLLYLEFTLRQSLEHFLSCQKNAFAFLGGVPQRLIVDNCKTAVLHHPPHGEVVYHPRYLDFAAHYGFTITACNVRKPHEKGRVENGIGYLKKNFLNGVEIISLTDLQARGQEWQNTIANLRIHAQTKQPPVQLFQKEKPLLRPLPLHPYESAVITAVRANSQFRVTYQTNQYSVPAEYASRADLSCHADPDYLRFDCQGQLIAQHRRSYQHHQELLNPDHERELLQQRRHAREQKTLQHFLALSPHAEPFYHGLQDKRLHPHRHLQQILALVEIHGQDLVASALECACQFHAFSADYLVNLIDQRQRVAPPPSPLHLTYKPDLLNLELEPPNFTAYDPQA